MSKDYKTYNISYRANEIHPFKSDVLNAMGISDGVEIPAEIEDLYNKSFELYEKLIIPKGIYRIITKTDFKQIYQGEGKNDEVSPLTEIYPKASHLAMYVFTLGRDISDKIDQLVKDKDYPIGFMLDRIASESADKASAIAERYFSVKTRINNTNASSLRTLLYSPGYCGWHISAQVKLFEYLKPEIIGIKLNKSSLMTPIKSVSGVLVSGKYKIHLFKNNFKFCRDCNTFSCRERMQ